MTPTLSKTANDGLKQFSAPPADRGLATALNDLVYEAIRPLRYLRLYYKFVGDLERLDNNVLDDIGLSRWEISSYALSRAKLRWPARHPLWTVLAGIPVALWRTLTRAAERRATFSELMMLNDDVLKDIGINRCEIPWVVNEVARLAGDSGPSMGRLRAAGELAGASREAGFARQTSQGPILIGEDASRRISSPANDSQLLKAS